MKSLWIVLLAVCLLCVWGVMGVEAKGEKESKKEAKEAEKRVDKTWEKDAEGKYKGQTLEEWIAQLQKKEGPSAFPRGYAAYVLGNIKEAAAAPHLVKALLDENSTVRDFVGDAIVMVGKPCVPHLIEMLGNKDEDAKNRAIGALKVITGEDYGDDAAKWKKWAEKNMK